MRQLIKKYIENIKGELISIEIKDIKHITIEDAITVHDRYYVEDTLEELKETSDERKNIEDDFFYLYTLIFNEKTGRCSASRLNEPKESIIGCEIEVEKPHDYTDLCPGVIFKMFVKTKKKLDDLIYRSRSENNLIYTKLLNLGYIDHKYVKKEGEFYIYEMITNFITDRTRTRTKTVDSFKKDFNMDDGFLFDMEHSHTKKDPVGFIKAYDQMLQKMKAALLIDEKIFDM